MRIYISGPMKDHPDNNYPAFIEASQLLRDMSMDVVSPHKLTHNHGQTHAEFMREDLYAMLTCDSICMLNGWPNSRGARDELHAACSAGLSVFVPLYNSELKMVGLISQSVRKW